MRKTRAAQRRTTRMEAAYGKCLSAAFSDGLGDARSGVLAAAVGRGRDGARAAKAARAAAAPRLGAGGLGRVLRRGRRVVRAVGASALDAVRLAPAVAPV